MKNWQWVGVVLLFMCTAQAKAETVHVAVAANFSHTMQALVAEFEQDSPHKIVLSFGSSGKFYAQIKHGAPYHLFFSADQTKPHALQQEGLIVAGSRFTYALGHLALWSAKIDVNNNLETKLKKGEFNKLAMANPKLAPYGAASLAVLEYLDLTNRTQAKWVQGENVSQTFQFVATGNADMGFVALSQLLANRHYDESQNYWLVPHTMYPAIKQDVVWLAHAEKNNAAEAFLRFVKTDNAQQVMARYGYSSANNAQVLNR